METYGGLLVELSHVSDVVRQWSNHIFNRIKNSDRKSDSIVIKGEEDSELYDVFSVDFFIITLDRKTPNIGYYDENSSGYKNGKYYVYITLDGNLTGKYIINHELRHAYEDYKRKSKNRPGLDKTKESNLLFSGDFTNLMLGDVDRRFMYFKNVIKGLYFTSKIEESAYSETVYDLGSVLIDRIRNEVKYDYINSWKKIYSPDVFENNWVVFKKTYNIPILNKFNDYQSFLNWGDKTIKNRGRKVLNKLLKIHYSKDN